VTHGPGPVARAALVGALVAALLPTLALGAPPAAASSSTTAPRPRTLTVSAASSLTDVMGRIARRFERSHPGVRVRLNLGSSATLARQIANGAPADVLATASESSWSDAAIAGRVRPSGRGTWFARNRLVVAVRRDGPIRLRTVRDVRRARILAMCVRSAPCGGLGEVLLRRAEVSFPESSITRAADARATLAALTRGDADAAIVYRSDAVAAGARVRYLDVGNHDNVEDLSVYSIAPTVDAADPALARAFVAAVRSDWALRLLLDAGFMRPPGGRR